MPSHPLLRPLSLALAGAIALCPVAARAQPDPREAAAKKACAAGRVDEGVEILAELFAQTGDLNYVYNQGRCYQQNGVHEKASQRFREYLRRAPDLPASERQEVERFISEAEEQLRQQQAARQAAVPDETGASPRGPWRIAALALGGLGAVAIGTGVALSLKVRGAEQDFENDLRKQPEVDNGWVAERNREGARLETFQWVAYGVGAAALAGGVACYFIGARASREPAVAVAWVPGGGFSTSLTVRY